MFVVTDLIEGPSLRQALAEHAPFPVGRVQALMTQALDAVAALHRRGGFIAGVNPDMIRLTVEDGHERIVMSTAGIARSQDVLATMREQELRGQEASEQELPYVAPEVLMGRRARAARRCLHDGRARLPDGNRPAAVSARRRCRN